MLSDDAGNVMALPASRQTLSVQCTHPFIVFTFHEEGYYFHDLSHPQFGGHFETDNVGPLIQQMEFSTVNPLQLTLATNTLDQAGAVLNTARLVSPQNNTIKTTLGAYNSFVLTDVNGAVVPAKYALEGAPSFNPAIAAAQLAKTAYPKVLSVMLNPGLSNTTQYFVNVHMGTQTLRVTPLDSKFKPFTMTVVVASPAKLGTDDFVCTWTYNSVVYDAEYKSCNKLIIMAAHQSGLPPQYIKAEIWQESNLHKFEATSYRYEPYWDRRNLRISASRSDVSPMKAMKVMKKYYFGPASNVVTSDLIQLRSKYKLVLANGTLGPIPNNYETGKVPKKYTPLLGIDYLNGDPNNTQKWREYVGGVEKPAVNSSNFGFVAQSVVASSYGMMQILYTTALEMGFVNTVGKEKEGPNPQFLFRPALNIQLGSDYLAKQYKNVNADESVKTDLLKNMNEYGYALRNASSGYNGGRGAYFGTRALNYGQEVWRRTKVYWISDKVTYVQN